MTAPLAPVGPFVDCDVDPLYTNLTFLDTTIQDAINAMVKRVVESEEQAVEGLLERAFKAGKRRGYDEGYRAKGNGAGSCWPPPATFPEWLALLKEEVHGGA